MRVVHRRASEQALTGAGSTRMREALKPQKMPSLLQNEILRGSRVGQ